RYTDLVMGSLLGGRTASRKHWSEAFDCVVVRAGKPAFFRNRDAARRVAFGGRRAHAFSGGGVRHLERVLGCRGDRILFFGDHTYGDILKSKRVCLWRTAMIVREVEREVEIAGRLAKERRKLERIRLRRERLERIRDHLIGIAMEPAGRRKGPMSRADAKRMRELVEKKIDRLEEAAGGLEDLCDRAHNPYWGPIFRTAGEPSYFASQLREFACIYTGRVSNFLHYPVDKYFQVRPELLPHEREEG
ncbi:MAG: hypothetical protein GF346_11000, partial [Candidatus Eisenbacteria bacterium]|nr:hypothetical protein [Candidatus Latescibacterota bacterium]MBD3302965.1 hypothetical protein [Candidatus Eisenbacteria bacterium]